MRRISWKTIIIYGVLPILLLAALAVTAIIGQSRQNQDTARPTTVQTTSAPATPADVCRVEAPAMLAAWRDGNLDEDDMADGAVIAVRPDPLPAMDGAWAPGLVSFDGGTVTCSVLAGGDEPFTVGLRAERGQWKTALIRLPGGDRP